MPLYYTGGQVALAFAAVGCRVMVFANLCFADRLFNKKSYCDAMCGFLSCIQDLYLYIQQGDPSARFPYVIEVKVAVQFTNQQ